MTAARGPKTLLYLREMQSKIEEGKQEEILAEHRPIVFYNRNLRYNACIEDLTRMHRSFPGQVLAHQLQAMIKDNDTQHLLPHIRAHTLVIHGRHDPMFDLDEAQRLADGIQLGRLAVIEDAAHGTPMEQPQAVTALMRLYLSYHTSRDGTEEGGAR